MHVLLRRSRILAGLAVGALGLTLLAAPSTSGAAVDAPSRAVAGAPVKAGADGPVIVVDDQASFSGIDLATDPASGVAYLGWISAKGGALRSVHLCVLPPKATACAGGVLTTSPVDGATAAGLQVEVTAPGTATLVWFHNVSLTSGALSTATYAGGVLSAPSTVPDAPAFGQLFDVVVGPDRALWAVTSDPSGSGQNLQIHSNVGVPGSMPVTAPFLVGNASLAFQGSQPVLLVGKAGSISDQLYYASGNPMGGFKPLRKTWTTGLSNDVVGTSRGVRAIASEDEAGYRPVVAKWTGSSFSKPRLIGENTSCPGLFHDLVSDASGRVADVVQRCGKVVIYNLPDTENAAMASFPTGGTDSSGEGAQITTQARGYGWVAWSILSPTQVGNRLQVRAVRLPALMIQKSQNANPGKVTVKGPASCLPVVSVRAKVSVKAGRGWNVGSKSLMFEGENEGTSVKLDGEKLKSGKKYTLLGKGVFRRGGQTATVTQKLKFKVC